MRELKHLRTWNQRCYEDDDGNRRYIIRGKRWHRKVQGQWLDDAEIQALGMMLPMADTYGGTADGWIRGVSAIYAKARSTSTASNDTDGAATIGQKLDGGQYTVARAFLLFDTSGIEDSDTVTAATLNVKASTDVSGTDFLVQVYRFAWAAPLADNREADYDGAYGGSATLEGTLRNTADGWSSGTYYSMAVDTEGINKAGDTKYSIVSKRDVDGTAPAGLEYVLINTADAAGTGSDPYLSITAVQLGFGCMF